MPRQSFSAITLVEEVIANGKVRMAMMSAKDIDIEALE